MPGAARLNDLCGGHGCWPPRNNIEASNDTFVNARGIHRQSDNWATHCCDSTCHGGYLASGSPNVYVNTKQMGRCGDPVNCGSYVNTCSNDTIIN